MLAIDRTEAVNGSHVVNRIPLVVNEKIIVNNHFWNQNKDYKKTYELAGAIIYEGDLKSGHYRTLKKKLDQWTLLDDEKVTIITQKDAKKLIEELSYIIL